MQSLRDLSHLEIIFQKAQSRISIVLFVAHNQPTKLEGGVEHHMLKYSTMGK